jgi:hypothetical protein
MCMFETLLICLQAALYAIDLLFESGVKRVPVRLQAIWLWE